MFIVGFILGANIGMILTAILKANKKTCLHCGKNDANYCEDCYQELISKNAKLQWEKNVKEYEVLKAKVEEPKMFIVEQHIPRID